MATDRFVAFVVDRLCLEGGLRRAEGLFDLPQALVLQRDFGRVDVKTCP
jgi:hypothetical protein